MVALQILSKVILSKDIDIITGNDLTEDYFLEYEDEYNFVMSHYKEFGNVPDKATFLAKFPDVELVEVSESDDYLIKTIREEWTFNAAAPIVQQMAKLLKTDANAAVEYMIQSIPSLQPHHNCSGVDIVAQSRQRFEAYKKRRDHKGEQTFTTGFPELDDAIHGIERTEELIVLFARINNGKSFIAEKICTHIWQIGYNVGYLSPEMSPSSIGYRFDTLYKGFSNKSLMWANDDIDEAEYKQYIDELAKHDNKFLVATPMDFDKKITVTKLREWIKANELDMIAIDGITYLTDERGKRNDNTTTKLTNISEDLMSLTIELGVPILVVVQANRSGVINDAEDEDATPDLENIKDSDGIAANASKVLSLRHTKDGVLKIGIKKQRFGPIGGQLSYEWNPDNGEFKFMPKNDSHRRDDDDEEKPRRKRRKRSDAPEDAF